MLFLLELAMDIVYPLLAGVFWAFSSQKALGEYMCAPVREYNTFQKGQCINLFN